VTDKERIYRYLNGKISRKSFRKWLLSADNLSDLFKSDAGILKDLAEKYSLTGKIYEILNRHIETDEYEKFSIKLHLEGRKILAKDPIDLVKDLSSIQLRIKDQDLVNKIKELDSITVNMPTSTEKQFWDKKIFELKRASLEQLTPVIISTYNKVLEYASTPE
jgi:hypothetical protein